MSAAENHHTPPDTEAGYERRDINIGKSILWALAVVVVIVVFLFALNEYFLVVTEEVIQEQVLSVESAALSELRTHEEALLNTYELVDTAHAGYRIPIGRAMELIAAEALNGAHQGP